MSIPPPEVGAWGELESRPWPPVEERKGEEREVEEVANPRRGGTLCTFVYI